MVSSFVSTQLARISQWRRSLSSTIAKTSERDKFHRNLNFNIEIEKKSVIDLSPTKDSGRKLKFQNICVAISPIRCSEGVNTIIMMFPQTRDHEITCSPESERESHTNHSTHSCLQLFSIKTHSTADHTSFE